MRFTIGIIIVFASVLGCFHLMGGSLIALYQPGELGIIGGAGVGAFVIANPRFVLLSSMKSLKTVFKGMPFDKSAYIELLSFLFNALTLIRTKGLLAIESQIDEPKNSELFTKYPTLLSNHHALDFFCDYMRLISMGVDSHYQIDDQMIQELDLHHQEEEMVNGSIQTLSDAFPAIGIVAAVLGVIKTMASINEPPEILGALIGGALVGTFLGIFLSYCMVGPIYAFLHKYSEAKGSYILCIKAAIISYLQGNAPSISVEFARKSVPDHLRPTFLELEEKMNENTNA